MLYFRTWLLNYSYHRYYVYTHIYIYIYAYKNRLYNLVCSTEYVTRVYAHLSLDNRTKRADELIIWPHLTDPIERGTWYPTTLANDVIRRSTVAYLRGYWQLQVSYAWGSTNRPDRVETCIEDSRKRCSLTSTGRLIGCDARVWDAL